MSHSCLVRPWTALVNVFALLLVTSAPVTFAAEPNPPPTPPSTKPALKPLGEILVARIVNQMRQPDFNDAAAAEAVRELESFLATREGAKTREVAQVRFLHASLIVTVLRDHARGLPLIEKLSADIAGTDLGNELSPHLYRLTSEAGALKRVADSIGQPAPPLKFAWCSDSGVSSLDDLLDQVVVLDFWVTLETVTGRSYGEALPALRALAERYSAYDVTFVAVTSIQGGIHGIDEYIIDCEGEPEKEHALMSQFMKKHAVNWTVAFSEEDVFDARYGIRAIPYTVIIAPDGTVRRSDYFGALPVAERSKIIDELLDEAGLLVPPAG